MIYWRSFRWKHIGLQVVLWGALLAVVGLAGLITFIKQQSMRVKLDDPATYGHLRVRLPHQWKLTIGPEGQDSVSTEEMLPRGQTGRRITVWRQRIGPNGSMNGCPLAPTEFLLKRQFINGILTERDLNESIRRGEIKVAPIDVGGWPGTAVNLNATVRTQNGTSQRKQCVACAILPGAQAIVVEVIGFGPADESDRKLLEQICDAVGITGLSLPQMKSGQLTLPDVLIGGNNQGQPTTIPSENQHALVYLTIPRHFYLLNNDDPNLLARQMVREGSDGAWIVGEFITCLFFPGSGFEEFRAMLLARDRDFGSHDMRRLSDHLWRADSDAGLCPTRAYLLSEPNGAALLMVMHGDLHTAAEDFDRLWAEIEPTVKFGSVASENARVELPRMLRMGAEEANQLSAVGLAGLLPRSEAQGWSLANEAENADKSDWMELRWSTSGTGSTASWWGDRRTPYLEPAAAGSPQTRVHQQWNGYGNLSLYSTTWTVDRRSVGQRAWISTGKQPGLTLEHGQLRHLAAPGESALAPVPSPTGFVSTRPPASETGQMVQTSVPLQFVPGGWLPLLMEHIAADTGGRPVIMQTDSFVGCDGLPLNCCLMVTIWRDPRSPLKTDENGEAMDCVSASVNGTGRVSRWYFSKSGALRYINFADWLLARQDPEKRIAEPMGLAPDQP